MRGRKRSDAMEGLLGDTLRRLLPALLIGAVGGAVFAWLDLPLAWMLGSMMATMSASLLGMNIAVPPLLRKLMFSIIGVILGSSFTHDRLNELITWLPSIAAMPLYILALGGGILVYLRQVSDFDHKTAFFAAAPGGLSEMIMLADQLGGDMRNVALFHSARLVLLVFAIPLFASVFITIDPNVRIGGAQEEASTLDMVLLLALSGIGILLGKPLRLPAYAFMGPLLLSTVLHLTGLVSLTPPLPFLSIAQVVIGAAIGARFSGVPLGLIMRTLVIGGGGTLVMFVLTLVIAGILQGLTGYPLALLVLALMPGGFPEMSLIALALGLDPAFVVTHHGVRVMLIVAFALPLFSWLVKRDWFTRYWSSDEKG